jgi:hypothetical protein
MKHQGVVQKIKSSIKDYEEELERRLAELDEFEKKRDKPRSWDYPTLHDDKLVERVCRAEALIRKIKQIIS